MHYFNADLVAQTAIPAKGILSQTLHNDDLIKAVLFAFAPGEELSAHTAPMPATLHFLEGAGTVTLGDETSKVQPGSFAYMPPNLAHGIVAETGLIMLLLMIKGLKQGTESPAPAAAPKTS
jgi:quercetin dioxygenase-like cupin family protein